MGRVVDAGTGLQYLVNRYYDPLTTQFLTRDPLTDRTRSAYGYTHANPVNRRDPLGLQELEEEAPIEAHSAGAAQSLAPPATDMIGQATAAAADGVEGIGPAAETAGGPGGAALDTNVLIRGLDNGELDAVDKALGGRIPNVSPTAAEEYLVKGSQSSLDQFLGERGGSIGLAGTQEGAAGLQAQAAGLGRALGLNDALVANSAMQEGIPLVTGDQQLLRFLGEIGYPAEGF